MRIPIQPVARDAQGRPVPGVTYSVHPFVAGDTWFSYTDGTYSLNGGVPAAVPLYASANESVNTNVTSVLSDVNGTIETRWIEPGTYAVVGTISGRVHVEILRANASNDSPWEIVGPSYSEKQVLSTDKRFNFLVSTNNLIIETPTTRPDGTPLQVSDTVGFSIRPSESFAGVEDLITATGVISLQPAAGQELEGRTSVKPVRNDLRVSFVLIWDGTGWWVIDEVILGVLEPERWQFAGPSYGGPVTLLFTLPTQFVVGSEFLDLRLPTIRDDWTPLQVGDSLAFSVRPTEDYTGPEDVVTATAAVVIRPGTGQRLEGRAADKTLSSTIRADYRVIWDGADWWITNQAIN